jgi:hypothetical protein
MDNRLDFISKFKNETLAGMEFRAARERFIEIDAELQKLLENPVEPALARSVSLARTYLEQSLQYTIKSLCLKHEDK